MASCICIHSIAEGNQNSYLIVFISVTCVIRGQTVFINSSGAIRGHSRKFVP
jgi:hypothetical protein